MLFFTDISIIFTIIAQTERLHWLTSYIESFVRQAMGTELTPAFMYKCLHYDAVAVVEEVEGHQLIMDGEEVDDEIDEDVW